LGEAPPHLPLLRGPAVEDGTAAGSDLVVVGDVGGIELAVGGRSDVGFGCRLRTVVVPAVQSACGASAAQRVHCSCSPDRSGWWPGTEGVRSRVEVGEAVGGLAQCLSKMPWVGEYRHDQRLDQGEPMLSLGLVSVAGG
jgi:hypothetical protein